jgi:hypothetical protein
MAFGIVILSILMVYGTVMWVKPSAKDRRLAELRMNALKDGIKVQQGHIDDLSIDGRVNRASRQVFFYRLLKNSADRPTVTLLRTTGESGIYLPDGWAWEQNKRLPPERIQPMTPFLLSLPESVFGIEMSPGYVGIAWDERDPSQFDQVKQDLSTLLTLG